MSEPTSYKEILSGSVPPVPASEKVWHVDESKNEGRTTYRRGTRNPKEDKAPGRAIPVGKDIPWRWEEDGYTVTRSTARSAPGCHNVCGVLLYEKDGVLEKVEGDPLDPYIQGRLCSRCLCIPDYVYHEERLKYPMKRAKEDRGKDKFERITWDEAYQIIEDEFKRVADTWDPETIMTCQGIGRDIHQITRLNASNDYCQYSIIEKSRFSKSILLFCKQ